MISFASKNNIELFKNFILPEEFQTHKKNGWRPVVSVKARVQKVEKAEGQNFQRKTWHFLTLGIPLIFNSLALFFSSLLHRDTTGFPLRVRFKQDRLSFDKMRQMVKFRQFNLPSPHILNDVAQKKGQQQVLKLINKLETAKLDCNEDRVIVLRGVEFLRFPPRESSRGSTIANGSILQYEPVCDRSNPEALTQCKVQEFNAPQYKYSKKLNALKALLEKNATPGLTYNHLDDSDWQMLDKIAFKLLKEHFEGLLELFNSEWMATSGLSRELQAEFGFHYMEAVVAESLALSLAYIEGMEGKTIFLPLFNEKLNRYESAAFVIKKTTLGDALPCYILESENTDLNPWLVIRGSQIYTGVSSENKEFRQGSLESILADSLDPECISGNVINKALVFRPVVKENGRLIQKESLSDLFFNWQQKGKKVNLSGHSLGGTLVNALAVEFHDQIDTAYSFSGAGVSHKTAKRYQEIMKRSASSGVNEKLISFDYEGDIVPSGGRRLIGTHLAITSLQNEPKGVLDSHLCSHLNQDFQIQKIDVEKETHKWTRWFCERLRIIVGAVFNVLLQLFSRKYIPDWWKNRKIYEQRAEFQRKNLFNDIHL